MRITITTHKHIDSSELDDLITETYGRPYCYQQQDGCRSRGMHTVTVPEEAEDYEATEIPEEINGEILGVSFAAWLARDPKAPVGESTEPFDLVLFWERNFYPEQQMVLNDLHARGLLDAGEYKLVIDW